MFVGLAVTFRFEEVTKAGIELGGEFGFEGVEGVHGSFQFFGPVGMRRFHPTLADDIKIVGQGGMEAGFEWGKSHNSKIERG